MNLGLKAEQSYRQRRTDDCQEQERITATGYSFTWGEGKEPISGNGYTILSVLSNAIDLTL